MKRSIDAGDTLTYTATLNNGNPLPNWLTFNATTRTFSGTPDNNNVGAIDVKITATDSSGANVSDVFKLTVANVNDAPVVQNAIADQTIGEGQAFNFTLPNNVFIDIDSGDNLTYSLANGTVLPRGLIFNISTLTFSGTPTGTAAGIYKMTVIATDTAGAKTSNIFTLNILNFIGTNGNDTLTGTLNNEKLVGLGSNDSLMSLAGNDTLDGGTGIDTMIGGAGDDLYLVDNIGDLVIESSTLLTEMDTIRSTVSFTLAANVENLILLGSNAINGIGNTLNNRLTGNAANNVLNGRAGNDTLIGGTGKDIYLVDTTGDRVIESSTLATEIDTVKSTVSFTLGANLENLILLGNWTLDKSNLLTGKIPVSREV